MRCVLCFIVVVVCLFDMKFLLTIGELRKGKTKPKKKICTLVEYCFVLKSSLEMTEEHIYKYPLKTLLKNRVAA